jgi:hypothetical protein
LIKAVWKDVFVDESNFHVTLHAVRRALGESGRAPNYIVKTVEGYCFTAQVIESNEATSDYSDLRPKNILAEPKQTSHDEEGESQERIVVGGFKRHVVHIVASCSLYGALYATAVILEIAYRFDQFGATGLGIALLVFLGILISSIGALFLDLRLQVQGRAFGLLVAVSVFIISAGLLYLALSLFLPTHSVVVSNLQSYPAKTAYLEDECYFLVLSILFMVLPLHFVTAQENQRREPRSSPDLPTGNHRLAGKRTPYLEPWALAILLVVFALVSVAMTAHLIDNLLPGPYTNLFISLVYLRGILYFGLGIECLLWYWSALKELRVVLP